MVLVYAGISPESLIPLLFYFASSNAINLPLTLCRRFDENWTEKLESSLIELHPTLRDPQIMQIFRRKWHYMFMYMDVAYARKWLGVGCWVLKRPVSLH